jgi:alkanesulfonate monooxygenase SsuD/methylene tetrahydromethanopterin reductase-like flavin-dependent oxidoreductase (luciferase family)
VGALCFSLGTPKDFEPLIRTYKDAIRHAEPVGAYVNDNVACVTQLVCMEDRKKARAVAMRMGSAYHTSLVFRYLDTFPRPRGVPEWPALIPEPTAEVLEERIASGNRLVGDPDECARGVQLYADVGCDQLIFGLLASTQPQEVALHTIELFGKQVIPRFDRDPVHSTARLCAAAGGLG